MSLSSLLFGPRAACPFLLLQSSAAQTIFPVLRALCRRPSVHTILHSFLYDPASLISTNSSTVEIHDWTEDVPGYCGSRDIKADLLATVKSASKDKALAVVIDSLGTLSENLASLEDTYGLLYEVLHLVQDHPRPSQLIIHSVKPDETADLLLQTDFSSSLIHLISHPTSLLLHLSTEYMISIPLGTADVKFWSVFIPLSERMREVEHLCFMSPGKAGGSHSQIVVEILTRGVNVQSRKRGTERVLEGWDSVGEQPCSISDLPDLKSAIFQNQAAEAKIDPTQNLTFNLNLSESQHHSRAQVPLPYAREGGVSAGTISYDPDSADDIDDEDPDEDLDI